MVRRKNENARRALTFSGSKKGQVQDIVVAFVWIMIIVVGMIVGIKLLGSINTEFQDSEQISDQAKDSIGTFSGRFANIMDGSFVLIFAVIVLFLIISVFFVDSHPVFFVVTLPLFVGVVLINAFLINMVISVGSSTGLASAFDQMEMTQFLAANWIGIIIFVGFAVMVIFFGKRTAVGGA